MSASWLTLHVHRRHGRACCGDFYPGSRRWTSPAELPAAGQVDGGEVLPRFARQHGQHSGPHQASLRHGIPTGALSDGAVHTEQAHHVPANVASFKEHQWAGSKDCGLLVAPHLIRVRVVKIAYWWCGVFIEATFRHGYFWLGTSSHSTSARARPVTRNLAPCPRAPRNLRHHATHRNKEEIIHDAGLIASYREPPCTLTIHPAGGVGTSRR